MVLLGLLSAPRLSQMRNDPAKAHKYSELALAIADYADAHGRRVPLEMVDRCLGQFAYSGMIDQSLRSELGVVRDQIDARAARQLGGSVLVSARSGDYLRCMAQHMQRSTEESTAAYVCFAPRKGMLGDTGTAMLHIWTDASGNYSAMPPPGMPVIDQIQHPDLFHGWGAMYWVESDDAVYVTQQFITYNARATLRDSTAFELFGVTEALYVAGPALRAHTFEVAHQGDSTSATTLVNGGAPHQTAERVLMWQHSGLRDRLPPTLVVSTQKLRQFNQETDLLASSNVTQVPESQASKTKQAATIERLHDLVAARFGRRMRILVIAPDSLQRARDRMATVVRAKESTKESSIERRSVLPMLSKTRAAYAAPPQAHLSTISAEWKGTTRQASAAKR